MSMMNSEAIIAAMINSVDALNAELNPGVSYLLIHGVHALVSKVEKYECSGIGSLSTHELAALKGVSESSVSSVKKAIASGNSEFRTLEDWLLNVKKEKETRAKNRTRAAIQKMDRGELMAMLEGLGIDIR